MKNKTERYIRRALSHFSFLSDVHVVGGAVRDMIVGRDSDDIDLATSDRPEDVIEKAENRGWNVHKTGIDHGTVTATFHPDITRGPGEFEITTFRRDVSTDGRNATVEFADSVREDLKRRDFTINAMAVNSDMEIIDPFDGQHSIEIGLLNTVGKPSDRFQEDFLRIVRAIRFAARFDFRIGHAEKSAMDKLADEVAKNVSVERVMMETKKAFKDDNPAFFLDFMQRLGIFEDFLDTEIAIPNFEDIEKISRSEDRMLLLIREFIIKTVLDADQIQNRLSLSNEIVDKASNVGFLIEILQEPVSETDRRKFLARHVSLIDTARRIGTQAKGIPEECFEKPGVPLEPILSGSDLIELGYEEGPEIGDILDEAHRIQLEKGITNKTDLINLAT